MNFRVFSAEADLHEGIGAAVRRATESSFAPYIGIVGDFPEWLGDQLARGARRLHCAGDPDPVQRAIEMDDRLAAAEARDLGEPLDLVLIVGPPPASEPSWMSDARMIFVAIREQDHLNDWISRHQELERTWFFVMEDHWRDLVEPADRKDRT